MFFAVVVLWFQVVMSQVTPEGLLFPEGVGLQLPPLFLASYLPDLFGFVNTRLIPLHVKDTQ